MITYVNFFHVNNVFKVKFKKSIACTPCLWLYDWTQ